MKNSKTRRDKKRGGHTRLRREKRRGKTIKVKRKNEEPCRTVNEKPLA